MQESFVLLSPFTVKVLVRLEFKLILVLTVSSKQKEKRSQAASYMISAAMVIETCDHFLGLKVNWFDTLTVKQRQIMINNDVLLFLRPMRKHLTSSYYITVFFLIIISLLFFLIALKIINFVFLVLFSLSNKKTF